MSERVQRLLASATFFMFVVRLQVEIALYRSNKLWHCSILAEEAEAFLKFEKCKSVNGFYYGIIPRSAPLHVMLYVHERSPLRKSENLRQSEDGTFVETKRY